jgi:hypothetical protein
MSNSSVNKGLPIVDEPAMLRPNTKHQLDLPIRPQRQIPRENLESRPQDSLAGGSLDGWLTICPVETTWHQRTLAQRTKASKAGKVCQPLTKSEPGIRYQHIEIADQEIIATEPSLLNTVLGYIPGRPLYGLNNQDASSGGTLYESPYYGRLSSKVETGEGLKDASKAPRVTPKEPLPIGSSNHSTANENSSRESDGKALLKRITAGVRVTSLVHQQRESIQAGRARREEARENNVQEQRDVDDGEASDGRTHLNPITASVRTKSLGHQRRESIQERRARREEARENNVQEQRDVDVGEASDASSPRIDTAENVKPVFMKGLFSVSAMSTKTSTDDSYRNNQGFTPVRCWFHRDPRRLYLPTWNFY